MPAPDGGFIFRDVVDWLWGAILALIGLVYKSAEKKSDELSARLTSLEQTAVRESKWEASRNEIRSQLLTIFDKLDELKTLIYDRTDGDYK